MWWIPKLRTMTILFMIFILPRSGSVFCPCSLLLIKVLKKRLSKSLLALHTACYLFQGCGFEWERDADRQSSGTTQQYCFTGWRRCYTSWYPDPDIWSYSMVYCLVQSTITGRKRPQQRNSKKSIIFLTHPWLKSDPKRKETSVSTNDLI